MMTHARRWLLAICLLGTAVGSADALFWRWSGSSYQSYYPNWGYSSYYYSPNWSYSSYYYSPTWSYPVAYSYAPVTVSPPTYCAPTSPAQYAQPVAAPPRTTEPPLADSKKPVVTESHFSADQKAKNKTVVSKSQKIDYCRVGFWNLTGRQVVLRIDGKGHYVAKNKAITLTVARDFSYQLDGESMESVQVPDEKKTFEIVLR